MKKTGILFTLLVMADLAAASAFENQELLDSKVDSINAHRGVEIGGSIRAVAQASHFSTDMDKYAVDQMPDVERDEMAVADLDFHFRPFENVRANVMFRFGAGMQEYFSSPSKTMSVGWANVEGNIGNSFYWVVGDFRQQYSPLTLFAPGIDIMYEPTIFARKRHMAQKQELLEGNQRNLQGVNLQFRQNLGEALGEVRAEALFARLNRTTVLDFSGAEGNVFPNGNSAGSSQASNTDKWLGAANLELLPLNKNLYLGVTPMYVFDNENTYSYTYRHEDMDVVNPYVLEPINPYEVDPQKTLIFSGRVGADLAGIMGNKNLTLDLVGEYARSSDELHSHTVVPVIDATTGVQAVDPTTNDLMEKEVDETETQNGSAILVTLNAGYKVENSVSALLTVDFIRNDSSWYNNLAQSPQFFARRILNSDKDRNTVRYGVNSPLYSTFDALYNYTPKFSPVTTSMQVDGNGMADGYSDSYDIAPINKNSWNADIYGRTQLALLATMFDPAIQLTLPNGLATSNRQGVRGVLTLGWKDIAEAQGLFSMFNQVAPLTGFKEASFTEFGGGAKVDIFKMLGFKLPLEISGSYKHSERGVEFDATSDKAEFKSNFINAGLYVQYLPRLGITAGLQYISSEYNAFEGALSGLRAPLLKSDQMQWMVGLDYTLASNAWFSLNYGIISVANEYNTAALVAAASSEGAYNMPVYYDVTKDASGKFKNEFTQSIIEASINVEF